MAVSTKAKIAQSIQAPLLPTSFCTLSSIFLRLAILILAVSCLMASQCVHRRKSSECTKSSSESLLASLQDGLALFKSLPLSDGARGLGRERANLLIIHTTKVDGGDDIVTKACDETTLNDLLGDAIDKVLQLILLHYQ